MPNVTRLLAASLDLTEAAGLSASLLASRGTPLVLDASAVERLGAQCLQVLLAAKAAWRADRVDFAIVDASPAFADALATLGATRLLASATGEARV